METIFASNDQFFEPDELFNKNDGDLLFARRSGRRAYSGRGRAKQELLTSAKKFVVKLAVGVAAATTITVSAGAGSAWTTPIWTIESAVPPDRAPNAKEFQAARAGLGMKQREAAAVLHVSESALEKYEQGSVVPGSAFATRYQALIDLEKLLTTALKGDQELIQAYLRGNGPFFGGESPLTWAAAKGRTDGIFEILSVYKRALS